MDSHQLDTLWAAAADGIDQDGLTVAPTDDAYRVQTPIVDQTARNPTEFREALSAEPSVVTNWYYWQRVQADTSPAHYAFLRWVEGIDAEQQDAPAQYDELHDGVSQEWGEVLITVTVGADGDRRYTLKHRTDRDQPSDKLTRRDDPHQAWRIAKTDADGQYRPIKGAPTLPSGWIYVNRDWQEMIAIIDQLYPATIANWYRAETGSLDVTHWDERLRTWMGSTDSFDPTTVDAIAQACCVDSQCLKRREWDKNDQTPLSTARGDGSFPCREPCPLVVTAGRYWQDTVTGDTETYPIELTPEEKTQLEHIVQAVADGTAGDVRDGDVEAPANRYRARFLQAMRFVDGSLPTTNP